MRIAILDDYQNIVSGLECIQLLAGHTVDIFTQPWSSRKDMISQLSSYEAIVLTRERTILTKEILAELTGLKIISQTGRPGDHVDLKACEEFGKVLLAGNGSPVAPAELAWSLIMAAQKRLPLYINSMNEGTWQSSQVLFQNNLSVPRLLKNNTLGIFGLGKIGSLIASYGKAFEMKVLVWGRDGSKQKAHDMGFEFAKSQDDLFERSDILTLHLRLNKESSGIVNYDNLSKMKKDSIFVNTSRSDLLEKNALSQCLENNKGPFLFALDVHSNEPSSTTILYNHTERILATPHIGFFEIESLEMYYRTAFQNIINFLNGDKSSIYQS
jgi:D-3-phosphoglycerate dehydrogenase